MALPPGYLDHLLNTRLDVCDVQVHRYSRGIGAPETVVPTPRILLVLRGEIRYQIESTEIKLRRGSMLGVAARTRRMWCVESGKSCEIAWVEFESELNDLWVDDYQVRTHCDLPLEHKSFLRLLEFHQTQQKAGRLVQEAELKALLARFFFHSKSNKLEKGNPSGVADRAVDRATAYLATHYDDPDALDDLARRVNLSPNHFRIVFKKRIGTTAREYLTALRMRIARSYLRETNLSVKETAARTGFRDPLYFSRLYKSFWKRSPGKDRSFSP